MGLLGDEILTDAAFACNEDLRFGFAGTPRELDDAEHPCARTDDGGPSCRSGVIYHGNGYRTFNTSGAVCRRATTERFPEQLFAIPATNGFVL